jgi:hypothetical protein
MVLQNYAPFNGRNENRQPIQKIRSRCHQAGITPIVLGRTGDQQVARRFSDPSDHPKEEPGLPRSRRAFGHPLIPPFPSPMAAQGALIRSHALSSFDRPESSEVGLTSM